MGQPASEPSTWEDLEEKVETVETEKTKVITDDIVKENS